MKPTCVLFGFSLLPLLLACENGPKADNYSALMNDAAGLKPGANVYIAGVQVGRVNQVDLDGTRARVQFDIRSAPGISVTAGTCVAVGFYGLASDAHLSVDPGAVPAAVIAPGGEITCVKESALGKSGERAMASAEKLLSTALSGNGLVSRLLHDKKLADKVETFFDQRSAAEGSATEPAPETPDPDKSGAAPKPATPSVAPVKPAPKVAPPKPAKRSDPGLVNPFE